MITRHALFAGTAAAILALGACGQQGNTAAQTNAVGNETTETNVVGAVPSPGVATAADPGTERAAATATTPGATAAPVAVVAPPTPAPDVPAAKAAPLTEATTITQVIDQGSDVERIPYEGGWAWRRDGRIVRTASADGRRVAYFRGGETSPFLVQQDRQVVAVSNGKVQHTFTHDGRPQAPAGSDRKAGEQLAKQAVADKSRAADVAKAQPAKVQKEKPAAGDAARTPPAETTPANHPATRDSGSHERPKPSAQNASGKAPDTAATKDASHGSGASKRSTDSKTGKRVRPTPGNEADAGR